MFYHINDIIFHEAYAMMSFETPENIAHFLDRWIK